MRLRGLIQLLAIVAGPASVAAQQSAPTGAGHESCPPGTTETRPGSCRAPEAPAPSILDYRPRSTLVTAATRYLVRDFRRSTFTVIPAR